MMLTMSAPEGSMSDEDAEIAAACRGAPTWITRDAVRDRLRVFRTRYARLLAVAEAMSILTNMGRLLAVLKEDGTRSKST